MSEVCYSLSYDRVEFPRWLHCVGRPGQVSAPEVVSLAAHMKGQRRRQTGWTDPRLHRNTPHGSLTCLLKVCGLMLNIVTEIDHVWSHVSQRIVKTCHSLVLTQMS